MPILHFHLLRNLKSLVAVKHMNPCGVGIGDNIETAFKHAYDADNQSIFGGIIALNRTVTSDLVKHYMLYF